MLAWTPGGLPAGFAGAAAKLAGVDHVVAVVSGTAWLTRSFRADGSIADRPPAGLAIPVEVAGADLAAYAPFLAPPDRALLPLLDRGRGALGSTSAAIRHLGAGSALQFGGRTVAVAGMLPDAAIGANEVFVSLETARMLGIAKERYLLIDPASGTSRARLTAMIRALLPAGTPIRIRGPGETPYFRQGDAVLPPVRIKQLFGEFAARPLAGGLIQIDPAWVGGHIVGANVPILGPVRCNRGLIPQLRGALGEIAAGGLSALVHRGSYGGCFSPRFINENPTAGISHHAWGVAIDLNVSTNPFGRTPHQDRRLVAIFERWGFTWGGRWLVPDGMHFEFVRFAPGS
jgi:hypothetical protein